MVFKYPYTDMYALNLDWMIQAIKEVQQIIEALGSVVHTFNNREGNVELLPADVNGLNINILHRLGPGVAFDSLTQAQLKTLYDSGVRIVVTQNQQGRFYRQYLLLYVGGTITGTEFLPVPGETQVLSFNERTGDVELLAADVNNLHINFVYPILDAMSGHTADFKTWYNTGIRFVQEKVGGVENWYYLTSSGDGDEQTVTATIYDPLKGRGLVKSVEGNTPNANGAVSIPEMVKKVNDKTPSTGGAVYVYGTDIDMANDDDTSIESAINTNSDNIGTLSSLNTTEKTNLVAALNESFDYPRGVSYNPESPSSLADACRNWVDSLPNDYRIHYGIIFYSGSFIIIAQKYTYAEYASYIAYGYNKEPFFEYKASNVWSGIQKLNNAPQIAIQQLTNIASRNIAVGSYVIWQNELHRAKSNITSGDTLSTANMQILSDGGLNRLQDEKADRGVIVFSGVATYDPLIGGLSIEVSRNISNGLVVVYGYFDSEQQISNRFSIIMSSSEPTVLRPIINATKGIYLLSCVFNDQTHLNINSCKQYDFSTTPPTEGQNTSITITNIKLFK